MLDNNRDHFSHLRRQRSSAILRVFSSLVGWGLLLALLASALIGYSYLKFTGPGPLQSEKTILIPQGTGRTEIAALLKENGAISSVPVFAAASAANALRGRTLKPGEYAIPAGASMLDIMALLNAHKVLTYKLTIPEGWTTEMAVARINENVVLQGAALTAPPEGTVIANTLIFERGTTRGDLLAKMVSLQSKLVDDLWASRPADSVLKSKEEFVTLASIVEKETGAPEERPVVAAVFINRLKQGIRLQSDPTIIYGLVGGKGKLDRPLTRSDIDGTTPYNTYQIAGLPPGPIAIPGKASLQAVLSPASVNYIYFVADGTGAHAFAATLEEHNANVRKWRHFEVQSAQEPASATVPTPTPPTPAPPTPAVPAAVAQIGAEPPLNATGLDNILPEKPAAPATPAQPDSMTRAEDPVVDLKPGSVVRSGNRLVPIPAQRKTP
jgi:UPF0755 protein